MPARITSETVIQRTLVRVLADVGAHKLPAAGRVSQATNNVFGEVLEIGLAPRQQVRPRLSEQVLHGIGDEPRRDDGQGQTQPASVQLPKLALPDQRLGRSNRDGGPWDKNEGNDGDDDNRGDNGAKGEEPERYRLLDGKRKAKEVPVRVHSEAGRLLAARGGLTYEMSGLSSENGRLFGVRSPRA